MKNIKDILLLFLIVAILFISFISNFTNLLDDKIMFNVFALTVIFGVAIYVINLLLSKDKSNSFKNKERLFLSLLENSDTIYIMVNLKNKKIIYLSENIEELLGIKTSDKTDEEIATEIFNLPELKEEVKNISDYIYVSQMIPYDNPKYNHQMWIKLKVFTRDENNDKYKVIEIVDATKDHNRQHLLITQASNIKARENQLNQITSKSYDVEMNVNLVNSTYELKYFKKDNLYFGEERKGKYNDIFNDVLNKCIKETDKQTFLENFSMDKLKEKFEKFELDTFTVRYRIGNELKNNIWLESTVFFLSNRHNSKVSILTKNVTEDAESIREQNVMLQNALNDARIASKAKTELISTISHDIRSPLTNIIGLSEGLISKELQNDVKDDIININESSNEVLNIIDGLLDTNKIEKKLIEKQETEYSVLKLFNKIEENAKFYVGDKSIKLNLNLDNNLPVILYGDSKRINNAINEIIKNSIKYTDEGKIDIDVKGEKKNNNVNLIVEITDTGIGIEKEKLESIMSPREDNQGINSVRNLVKILGGTFEIESEVGKYTKVTLSFIQKIVEDNKVRELMNKNKKAEVFNLKGKRVLIVDDNKLNLKVTSRLLEPYELDLILVESGEECIDLVKEQNNFDLILMDQMMPGMDGTTTLLKLKEIENFNTKVVVLTADAMIGQREKYLEKGFDEYISKPIDKQELSIVLKKFLKNQQ